MFSQTSAYLCVYKATHYVWSPILSSLFSVKWGHVNGSEKELFTDASFYGIYCNLKEMLKSCISDIHYYIEILLSLPGWHVHRSQKVYTSHHLDRWLDEDILSRRPQSHSCPHPLKSSHTVNISSFLPQALSTDISCIWDFLLKNLHMTLFSHYLGHWQNADSSEIPSLTTLYKVAHHSNPNDYCPSLTFPKALIAWNFIVQSFVYIFLACLSQLESEFWSTNFVLFKAKFSTTTMMPRIYIALNK